MRSGTRFVPQKINVSKCFWVFPFSEHSKHFKQNKIRVHRKRPKWERRGQWVAYYRKLGKSFFLCRIVCLEIYLFLYFFLNIIFSFGAIFFITANTRNLFEVIRSNSLRNLDIFSGNPGKVGEFYFCLPADTLNYLCDS